MSGIVDPHRQVEYLQQCLSSDKKPLGFFLGAGCPMAIKDNSIPLIPDIDGLTKLVCEKLRADPECCKLLKIIEDHFVKDSRDNPNIEHILSHIRSLRVVAGKVEVRGISADGLDKLDSEVCSNIHEFVRKSLPNQDSPYHRLANWVNGARRDKPVEIFTTNYDLLMEQALEESQVPYFDGFSGSRKPFFDLRATEEEALPIRWARLWKLHGSINWYQNGKGVWRGSIQEGGVKRVIHPSHLKYDESRRMPYLAMIDRLKAFLKQPTAALILNGYSFRDAHLNEVIIQGLQNTPSAIAFALLYGEIGNFKEAIKLANGRSNLTLLAKDGGVIGRNRGVYPLRDTDAVIGFSNKWIKWIPDSGATGKSKAEMHLGDFLSFGEFLQELTGQEHYSTEPSNA